MYQKKSDFSFSERLSRTLTQCDAQSGTGAEGGLFRVGLLTFARDLLIELGADPGKTAEDAGLDPLYLTDPNHTITFVALGKYLEKCVEYSQCPNFGYLLGSRASLDALGLMGWFIKQAPTLGAALEDLAVNQVRYARGATVFFHRYDSQARLGYFVYQQGMRAREPICTAAAAVGVRILKELAPDCRYEVHLAKTPPPTSAEKRKYEQLFGARVHFNAECYFLTIPMEELERPIAGAEPSERERLLPLIRDYWLSSPPDFCHLVFRTLLSEVLIGKTSLTQIAAQLSLHPRTLERRLEDSGTNFLMLREAARFEISRQLLVGTQMKLAGISLALGYAEPAVFSRAFRKWSGVTPKNYRAEHSDLPTLGRSDSPSDETGLAEGFSLEEE